MWPKAFTISPQEILALHIQDGNLSGGFLIHNTPVCSSHMIEA